MKKNAMPAGRQGFVPIIIILVIAVLILGLYFIMAKSKQSSTTLSPTPQTANYDGHYEYCQFKDFCNFINIKTLSDGKTSVDGQAYWVGSNTTNTGAISGVIAINAQKAYYEGNGCKIDFSFGTNQIIAKERQDSVCGGINVSFDGTYIASNQTTERAKLIKEPLNTLYSLECDYETKECSLSHKSTLIKKFTLPERLFSAYIYIPKNILAIATYEKTVGEDPINLYVVRLDEGGNPIKVHTGRRSDPTPTEIINIKFSPSGNYLVIDELDWETTSILVSLVESKELNDKRKSPQFLEPDWSPSEKHFLTYLTGDLEGYSIECGTISAGKFETLEVGPFPPELKNMKQATDTLNTYWDNEDNGIIEFKNGENNLTKYYRFNKNSKALEVLKEKPDLTNLTLSPRAKQEQILKYRIRYF